MLRLWGWGGHGHCVRLAAPLCVSQNRQRRTSSRAVSRTDRDLSTVRRTCDDQVAAAAERACGFGLSAAPPGFGLAARENCVMHCMAPPCYEEIYGADPLEDGEIDTMRGRKFRVCAKVREAMVRSSWLELVRV